MIRKTGSITLSRVQLFINNLPFYCKLPPANGTLIKTKFDLCYFAVWQWQAAHSSAESTQLCSKMWQHAFFCMLPSPRPQLPWKKPAFCWCRKQQLHGFSSNTPIQHSQNGRPPRKHRQKKCVTTVTCPVQPSNRLQWPCLKFDMFLQEKFTCLCSTHASSHYCSYTVSNSGCLLRPKNCFPLGGRKACPMLGKAVQVPVKVTLKRWCMGNGIVLHSWHYK